MITNVALTLGLGTLGGFCAYRLHLPLPWMIGPLLIVSAVAYAGVPVAMWSPLRDWMIGVVGIVIGAAFVPGVFDHAGDWMLTLFAMVACTMLMIAGGATLLYKGFGRDRATASLGGAPGTLSQMIAMSIGTSADIRAVSLLHTIRLTTMVLIAPALLMVQSGTSQVVIGGKSWQETELLILAICLFGFPLARQFRVPSPALLGPAIASALAHYAGFVQSDLPEVILAAAQVAISVSVGVRFRGVSPRLFAHLLLSGICLTAFLSTIGLAFAVALHWITDYGFTLLLLAFLPGGTSEMVIVAVALSIDPAFVASHHLLRMIIVTALIPLLAKRHKHES